VCAGGQIKLCKMFLFGMQNPSEANIRARQEETEISMRLSQPGRARDVSAYHSSPANKENSSPERERERASEREFVLKSALAGFSIH
jgi:hypothetical protein